MPSNHLQKLLWHEGFNEKVACPAFKRLNGQLRVGIGGHDHHGQLGVALSG